MWTFPSPNSVRAFLNCCEQCLSDHNSFYSHALISGGMFIIFQPLYDCSNKNFKSGQPSYPSNLKKKHWVF